MGAILAGIPKTRLGAGTTSERWKDTRIEPGHQRSRNALFLMVRNRKANDKGYFGCGSWRKYLTKFHGVLAEHSRDTGLVSEERLHQEIKNALESLPLGFFEEELSARRWQQSRLILPGQSRSRSSLHRLANRRNVNGKSFFGFGEWSKYLENTHATTIGRIREFGAVKGLNLPKPLAAHSPEELLALAARIAEEHSEQTPVRNASKVNMSKTDDKQPKGRAFGRIYADNQPLMERIVGKFVAEFPDRQDVIREAGRTGLLLAAEGFKPEYGLKFSTYAVPTVEGTIRNALTSKKNQPKISLDTDVLREGLHEKLGTIDPQFRETEARLAALEGVKRLLELHEARGLSAKHVMAILLESHGLGAKAIGHALGRSRQTATSYLNAAKRVLQETEGRAKGLDLAAGD